MRRIALFHKRVQGPISNGTYAAKIMAVTLHTPTPNGLPSTNIVEFQIKKLTDPIIIIIIIIIISHSFLTQKPLMVTPSLTNFIVILAFTNRLSTKPPFFQHHHHITITPYNLFTLGFPSSPS